MRRLHKICTHFPYTTLFRSRTGMAGRFGRVRAVHDTAFARTSRRSEEHTSELQSRGHLVCRLLLQEKKTREDNRIADTSTSYATYADLIICSRLSPEELII